jgi:peptidoglycan/xylan/chitin deacetylase (PgdA/CDA1 family)
MMSKGKVSTLIKQVSLLTARSTAFSRSVALLERVDSKQPNLLRVLMYHRVDEPDAHPALCPRLAIPPKDFDQQMSYLASNYYVVSMPELLDACQTGAILPPRSVMVTFDDAYCDFAEHAWPIMKRYRLPVTLFVPTAFPDQPERTFWWDRLHQAISSTTRRDSLNTPIGQLPLATAAQRHGAFTRLRAYVKMLPHGKAMALIDQICDELDASHPEHHVLGWEELRRLACEGVTLGAHTRTHPLMNRISPEEARAEAVGSLRDLEREIGSILPIFAYPSGGVNDETVRVLEHEGFALALTTVRGINDLRAADRLRLRRINVGQSTTLAVLRAQLLPWAVYLNRRPLPFGM